MWCEQPGFLLHRRPYRESSLLVTWLTPEQGRLDAVVRGARAARRGAAQKNAWLQPFQPLWLRWRARDGLVTLAHFEPQSGAVRLRGTALACGFYLNELLVRVLRVGLGSPVLFEQYGRTLELLGQQPQPPVQAWLLRQFELVLLDVLGTSLHLPEPFRPEQHYRWQADAGLQPSVRGIEGRCLAALLRGDFEAGCLGQQKRLLREMLRTWLGPAPLKSVEYLKPFFNRMEA